MMSYRNVMLYGITLIACHPGPRRADVHHSCPEGMVFVPGGRMTRHLDFGNSRGPAVTVELSPFCIDRTEVTIGAYAHCVDAGGCRRTGLVTHQANIALDGGGACDGGADCARYRANIAPDHPMNGMSWEDATAFCSWAGKRLPTDAEWDFAARGPDNRATPWGGADAWKGPDEHDCHFANECRCAKGHAAVGSFPNDRSPFGALDMEGNVFEYVSDWYSDDPRAYAGRDPKGPPKGDGKVIRGRSFWSECSVEPPLARARASAEHGAGALGFRCAATTR